MWGGWELALVSNNPSPPLNDNHKICQQRWPWMNGRPSQVHLHQQRMATGVKISRWDCSKTMGINAWMILQTFKFSETACKKNELYTSMHRPMEKKNNNNTKKKKNTHKNRLWLYGGLLFLYTFSLSFHSFLICEVYMSGTKCSQDCKFIIGQVTSVSQTFQKQITLGFSQSWPKCKTLWSYTVYQGKFPYSSCWKTGFYNLLKLSP